MSREELKDIQDADEQYAEIADEALDAIAGGRLNSAYNRPDVTTQQIRTASSDDDIQIQDCMLREVE